MTPKSGANAMTDLDSSLSVEALDTEAPMHKSSEPVSTPAEFPHLSPSLWTTVALTRKERIAVVGGDIVVRHPSVIAADKCARWLLDGPKRTRTTGMLVTGPVGAGKTTLAKLIWRRYAHQCGQDEAPIVMISMTGARHMRTVYGRILEALSGPVNASQNTTDREMAVTRLLRLVRCRGLIIDEVQDVLAGSNTEQRRTLDAIKYLMNELGLPVLAFGIATAEAAFKSDVHLDARFKRFALPLWTADIALESFLRSVERQLPLRKPSQFCTKVAMDFLIQHSGGSLDGIMTLLRHAAVLAILTGEERITYRLLEQALEVPDMEAIANVTD
jgi:hypothetical protein